MVHQVRQPRRRPRSAGAGRRRPSRETRRRRPRRRRGGGGGGGRPRPHPGLRRIGGGGGGGAGGATAAAGGRRCRGGLDGCGPALQAVQGAGPGGEQELLEGLQCGDGGHAVAAAAQWRQWVGLRGVARGARQRQHQRAEDGHGVVQREAGLRVRGGGGTGEGGVEWS